MYRWSLCDYDDQLNGNNFACGNLFVNNGVVLLANTNSLWTVGGKTWNGYKASID